MKKGEYLNTSQESAYAFRLSDTHETNILEAADKALKMLKRNCLLPASCRFQQGIEYCRFFLEICVKKCDTPTIFQG
jgi:hypothetical protein